MAKKKKGKRRRSGKRRKTSAPVDKATPLGLGVGATVSGFEILMGKTDAGELGPLPRLVEFFKSPSDPNQLVLLERSVKANMTDLDRYKGALFGAIVSASPKMPLVKIIAKPVDKSLRKLSKRKVSL